jgi:sugar O-acyltransferase (sialic acid O-acetyltransferase NeuD family)
VDVVIYGAGGHGRDIRDVVDACPTLTFRGFVDDHRDFYPGGVELAELCAEYGGGFLLGVNDPHSRFVLDRVDLPSPVAVHGSAQVASTAVLGAGSVVGALTVVGPGVVAGRHVHVGAGCFLTRARVGDYATVAPGVMLGGDVSIGRCTTVGIGARVRNLVTIGDGCTIGAGAVVLEDVPDGATVVGVPARAVAA